MVVLRFWQMVAEPPPRASPTSGSASATRTPWNMPRPTAPAAIAWRAPVSSRAKACAVQGDPTSAL